MRPWIRKTLIVASAAACATVAFAGTAGAGGIVTPNDLTIIKVFDGPVTAGTTFTVSVSCANDVIDDGDGGTDSASVTFDSAGQPTSPDTIDFLVDVSGTCTVTETANGGATSTSYECEGGPSAAPTASAVAAVCPLAEPISTPITMNKSFPRIEATVTVTNTFVAKPVTPPTPAAQVVAQPAFTG